MKPYYIRKEISEAQQDTIDSIEVTPEMLKNAQRFSGLGATVCASMVGSYDLIAEMYKVMRATEVASESERVDMTYEEWTAGGKDSEHYARAAFKAWRYQTRCTDELLDKRDKLELEVKALEKERDELKGQLFSRDCEDVDVIRYLKTLAYKHNHPDIPNYQEFAKRTLEKYVERSKNKSLTEHDAEVIEEAIRLYGRKTLDGNIIYVEGLRDYANQLRQKAQENQSCQE
jgi:hypothetical protein